MQDAGSFVGGALRGGEAVIVTLAGLCDFAGFPFETFDRFACVAVQACFAVDVAGELFDAGFQCFDRVERAGFLLGQRITLDLQALEHGTGDGLFLTQGWKGGFTFGAQFACAACF